MTTGRRSKADVLSTLRDVGIIPVIRAESADIAMAVVEALMEAKLTVAEITMTVPNAIDAIAAIEKQFGDGILIGAGTVTDAHTARRAMDAGAEFVVSPCLVGEVVDAARAEDVAVVPGGLTPTEIFDAFHRGADMVKVFPAQNVGGASYLRALRGPFPEIPLVPTGGVTLDNIGDLFAAGAAAVGVGSELVSKEALARRDCRAIEALARKFVEAARAARAR
jgi:2-dehydro-3-deoxyphosphogluconate aldolase / (4S)-4-hydroxy-2-oxoglutarate aldolase